MVVLRDILAKAIELGASDIHLKPGRRPFYRTHQRLL